MANRQNTPAPASRRFNVVATAVALRTASTITTPALAGSVIGATPEDLGIANRVRAALLNERVFQAADVDIVVRAASGQVNLSGWIGDVNDEVLARKVAANVTGATADDLTLATNVRSAVMRSPTFQESDVEIMVRAARGKVNLSGWLSYAGNDIQARKIAAAVPGVKTVTSDFRAWSTESDPRP